MKTGIVHNNQGRLSVSFRGTKQFLPAGGIAFLTHAEFVEALDVHLSDRVELAKIKRYPEASLLETSARNAWPILSREEMIGQAWYSFSARIGDDYHAGDSSRTVLTREGYVVEICKSSAISPYDPIILEIDYDMNLKELKVSGKYEWIDGAVCDDFFPIVGEGMRAFETCLIRPNREMSSKDCVSFIRKLDTRRPWEPASAEHLLWLGVKNPELQVGSDIVALGLTEEAAAAGDSKKWALRTEGSGVSRRHLGIRWLGSQWGRYSHFLAIRPMEVAK